MKLAAMFARVLAELEQSGDPDRRALLDRLQDGSYTPRDTSEVADMIEAFAERVGTAKKSN